MCFAKIVSDCSTMYEYFRPMPRAGFSGNAYIGLNIVFEPIKCDRNPLNKFKRKVIWQTYIVHILDLISLFANTLLNRRDNTLSILGIRYKLTTLTISQFQFRLIKPSCGPVRCVYHGVCGCLSV